MLVFVGLEGNPAELYRLISDDFKGPNSFVYWAVAILILGALGYIPGLEKLSKLFLTLVLLTLFLDNGGFFQKFTEFLNSTTEQPTKAA